MPTSLSSVVKSKTESDSHRKELSKSCYHADQQAKLMNLQAEVDSLLQELQNLTMQRLAENPGTKG
jgi:hypothetical protein